MILNTTTFDKKFMFTQRLSVFIFFLKLNKKTKINKMSTIKCELKYEWILIFLNITYVKCEFYSWEFMLENCFFNTYSGIWRGRVTKHVGNFFSWFRIFLTFKRTTSFLTQTHSFCNFITQRGKLKNTDSIDRDMEQSLTPKYPHTVRSNCRKLGKITVSNSLQQ